MHLALPAAVAACRPLDEVVVAWPSPEGSLQCIEPYQVAELAAEIRRHRTFAGPFDLAVVNPVLPGELGAAAYAAAGASWYRLAGRARRPHPGRPDQVNVRQP